MKRHSIPFFQFFSSQFISSEKKHQTILLTSRFPPKQDFERQMNTTVPNRTAITKDCVCGIVQKYRMLVHYDAQ